MRRARRLCLRAAVPAVPVAFLGAFFVYPLAAILGRGLAPYGRPDLGVFADVLGSARFREVVWFTAWQAALSTVLTVALALPAAHALARFRFPGHGIVRAAVVVPFVLPTVAVGAAFLALLGPGGPLARLHLSGTVGAILVAHVFFNYAVVVRIVGAFWEQVDPRQVDAARVLGASRLAAFRSVTLPLIGPAVAAAASIVFLFTFTSFGVVLLLGGAHRRTIEVEIYRQTVAFLDLPVAAVLAIVQLVAIVGVLVAFGRFQRRRARVQQLVSAAASARPPCGVWERSLLALNLGVMGLVLGTPIAVLVWRSFDTASGLGLAYYTGLNQRNRDSVLFVPPIEAVRNSLVFAAIATAIALVVGTAGAAAIASSRRGGGTLDALLMLPLGTSAVTVGFGFLIALDRPPVDLRTSPALVPIAHALVAAPFVVRAVLPALRSVDPRLREAAAALGASPGRVWREVDLPIVARALLVAASFAFAVSLGEFGATAFIVRPDYPTVPIAIFRALGRPGDASFGQAMALSSILVVLVAAVMLVFERVRSGAPGEL
jgi:thiamine transport system permease protein